MAEKIYRVGIIGAGSIAAKMASTVSRMKEASLYAIASRSLEKAEAFAKTHQVEVAYGSYEEMLKDEKVDLVYVATPHSHHMAHAKLCIQYGKPVLVEKAFTRNTKEAREVLDMAEEKKILVTEAIWTRYMPMRKVLDDILASGVIGKAYSLTAELSYPITHKARLTEPSLAGGALLDIGIYPLNFCVMVFGSAIKNVQSSAILSDKGMDLVDGMTITYESGEMAILHSDMRTAGSRQGTIYGEKGYIIVDNINNPEGISVYNSNHELIKRYETEPQITGYEYEVLSCIKAIEEGRTECPEMSHAETIYMMELMDQIRGQMGVVYPGE